ncbi:MAG: type II toxin-antitoxin system VapC family toxin [Firmicutes bacterium]|nr:type II toxin-antitoxin system VapC family toxin [Bacillota bacterium]
MAAKVYVDTSAFLAILNRDDRFHPQAGKIWIRLLEERAKLYTNSLVLLETMALLQNRLGLEAVRVFFHDIYPLLEVQWLDAELFLLAVSLLLAANRKELSLVDCSSFLSMQRARLVKVFAFDLHFGEEGFEVLK